ncbi:MAG: hypothetical protein HY608_02715 [Planctomycetes bacterium]|nr:hypothetical protein [Planctomycetota bacterium]
MPTTHPRINAVLEPQLFYAVERLAKARGVSLSQEVRDLVKESLELMEDAGWEAIVEDRRKSPGKPVPHAEARRRLGL